MLTRAGLERILVGAAVFLAHFPLWRHSAVFFTVSDLLFCLGLLTIVLMRGLPRAPLGPLMLIGSGHAPCSSCLWSAAA
jgi:hypothetical protein